eukprot:GCRY01002379.1.p1 GENE.GCRY01002379.1~~GCRY01002379.1.p1  ORF type:complete len:509 (-),score=63.90 GCRY01002379.1:579-2105(-)
MGESEEIPLTLGERVFIDEHIATVKFIGALEGKKGQWLGVEYDDANRGRHDGSFNGKSYFICSQTNAGSFVRYFPKVSLGHPFSKALKDRYLWLDNSDARSFVNGKEVELVGMGKLVNSLRKMEVMSLRNCVSVIDSDFSSLLPSVNDLDIGYSLFTDWDSVVRLVEALPSLTILRMDGILFQTPNFSEEFSTRFSEAFSNIRVLSLNRTKLSFESIMRLLAMLPSLEEIYLCYNGMTDFPLCFTPAPHDLRMLNLTGNPFQDFAKLHPLSSYFPHLSALHINDCSLGVLCSFPDDGPAIFPNLSFLAANDNGEMTARSFDLLNHFPKLTGLRVNTKTLGNSTEARRFIVAILPKISFLNGSTVLSLERSEGEKVYLQYCAAKEKRLQEEEGLSPEESRRRVSEDYPRYRDLLAEYGEVVLAEKPSNLLKKKLHSVELTNGEKSFTKKIAPTLTVRNLKLLCSKLFRCNVTEINVEIESQAGREKLSKDDVELSFYAFDANSKIHVNS